VLGVLCRNSEAEMQRGGSNQQVVECNRDSFGSQRAFYSPAKPCDLHCNRKYREPGAKNVDEDKLTMRLVGSSRAFNPMHEFEDSKHRNRNGHVTESSADFRKALRRRLSAPLGSDQHAGIENQAHRETSRGFLLRIRSSTASANSGSSTGTSRRSSSICLNDAITSEIGLARGCGAATTATGRRSFSITNVSPAWTRASTASKSFTASAAEMFVVAIFKMIALFRGGTKLCRLPSRRPGCTHPVRRSTIPADDTYTCHTCHTCHTRRPGAQRQSQTTHHPRHRHWRLRPQGHAA